MSAPSTISNPASFREEARFQRVCAVCESGGAFEAHHVVQRQVLVKRGLVHVLYDPRNALRLCERCHNLHTQRLVLVPTNKLTDLSICFVWQALGVSGQNYLERQYTGVERRFTRHTEGECQFCQVDPL